MNKKILGTVALACILSCTSQIVSAQSVSISSIPAKVFDLGKSILGSLKDDSRFCQKGNLFSGTVSIRSLDGNLCLLSPFARIAEVRCKNSPDAAIANDFKGSACDTKIARAYNNRTPAQALKEDIPKLPTPLRIAYCAQARLIKDPLILEACATHSTTTGSTSASTAMTSTPASNNSTQHPSVAGETSEMALPSEPASPKPAKQLSAFDRSIEAARQKQQEKAAGSQ